MKTKFLLLLAIALPFFNFAQITVEVEDLPSAGDSYANYTYFNYYPIAPAGADQVWDFSDLVANDSTAIIFMEPDSCLNSDMFPTADFCQYNYDEAFYTYYETDNGQFSLLGFAIEDWDDISDLNIFYDPTQLILPTPITFNDSYIDTSFLEIILPDEQGQPEYRLRQTTVINSVIDGWGTLILPSGPIEALRQTSVSELHQIDERFVNGVWETIDDSTGEITNIHFLSKDGYTPVLSQAVDPYIPNNDSAIQTIWTQPYDFSNLNAIVANFDFTINYFDDYALLDLTDASSNWPIEFLWTEDGIEFSSNSTATTFYSEDTVVEICLTVSNGVSSDEICKTIEIDLPTPLFANFTANEVQPMSGFYNFTNQSTGDITLYYWTIDGDEFSTNSDPSYLFSASGFYNVCLYIEDDNFLSDEFCTILDVQIGTAPTSNFNWNLLDNPGEYSFVDESTNDPTSWSWDFGDGNTSDLQHPSHTFTADGPFNVCLTATNNFGSDETCVNLDVNVGTNENQFPSSWSVFPNPTSEFINIHFGTSIPYDGQLSVYNMQGQLMLQKNINADQLLDAKTLVSGVFVLKIVDGKGQTFIKRIIKK